MSGIDNHNGIESAESSEYEENEGRAIRGIRNANDAKVDEAVNIAHSRNFPTLKEGASDTAKEFLSHIRINKNAIMRLYPNISDNEYNEITKRAIGIMYQESNAGESIKYKGKESAHNIADQYRIIGAARDALGNMLGKSFSRGYTQIKYDGDIFTERDRQCLKQFGINGGNDLDSPGNSGIATMIGLISNYNRRILPMKNEPFRRNNAEIIKVKFTDGETGYFARGKVIDQGNGIRRTRTEEEIQTTIRNRATKHGGGTPKQEIINRQGIRDNNDFYDFLYYARNKPTEIDFGTATPNNNEYIRNCRSFVSSNMA